VVTKTRNEGNSIVKNKPRIEEKAKINNKDSSLGLLGVTNQRKLFLIVLLR